MSLLLFGVIIAVFAVIIWMSRRRSGGGGRTKIYGQTCPRCKSDNVRSAGYSDRKECAKCGKIF